jgi:MFS superfamily sulfate permease-like transporter
MLGDMIGVKVASLKTLGKLWELALGAPSADWRVMGLSAFVAASILLGRRFAPHFPIALIVVIGMIAASAELNLAAHGFAVIGPVPGGLPSLKWPDVTWGETLSLAPVAASCFVMIIAQSAATSRVYAVKHKERVNENADILGLAAANAVAAVSGAFVVNGSPTQTAMAERTGAGSQVAQLVFSVVVLIVLVFLTGPLQYLPRSVLASIVFTIAVGMIDVQGMRAILRESRGEFLLALFTAAAVPAIGVEQGILLAIAASLIRHVRHSYEPHTMVLVPQATDRWDPAAPGLETDPGLIVYRFGADLFYANADRFADEVRALVAGAPSPVRWFIIDCSAIFDIDYTAARIVRGLLDDMASRKVGVVFARVSAFLHADLIRHDVMGAAGEARVFETLHDAIAAVGSGGSLAGVGAPSDEPATAKSESAKRSEAGS